MEMAMFEKQKSSKQTAPEIQEPKVSPQTPAAAAPQAVSGSKIAMIGKGISINGDVKASTSLKIEGQIEGRGIQSTEEVDIAESGHVTASIIARVVRISGTVTGDIDGKDQVLISRTGRVQGNIVAPRVQLEDGALFRGSIDMNPAEPAAAAKSEPAAKPVGAKAEKPAAAQPRPAASGPDKKEPGLNLKSG